MKKDVVGYRLPFQPGTGRLQRRYRGVEIPFDESGDVHAIVSELHVFEIAARTDVGVVDPERMKTSLQVDGPGAEGVTIGDRVPPVQRVGR